MSFQSVYARGRPILPKPESACFVIADISGYINFLAGVELDHAQDIIADVMDTVVRCVRPPFRLAKFEGDAAFFCAATDKVDCSVLQDAIEAAYFAFRKRLRNIMRRSPKEALHKCFGSGINS
jgi:class 3 adenylate cyclase